MRGLLDRLAGLDSGAERGLRVIQFFDELVSHRADAEAVTRATAVLSEATAGLIFDETAEVHVIDEAGRAQSLSGPGASALVNDITVGDQVVGRVWLERAGSDHREWDELVVARFSLTIANLLTRSARSGDQFGVTNASLVHTLLNEDTSETDIARAAGLLGFRIGRPVRAAAVRSYDTPVESQLAAMKTELLAVSDQRAVASPISESLAVLIFTGSIPSDPLPAGMVACVGPSVPVEECAQSWAKAVGGLRFASPSRKPSDWIVAEELGCLLALADLEPEQIKLLPDVQAVAAMATDRGGTDLEILRELGRQESMRAVATALHMHHSSISYRIDRISAALGFDVRSAEGSFRAQTAVLLYTILSSSDAADE